MAEKMRVDVWSDIACPWCYVGKRRLEAALERFPHRGDVQVVWRAFELDPAAPPEKDTSLPYAERLATKYRCSVAQAERMIGQMTAMARGDGLDFRFDAVRPGNTFDAHRVLHLAGERGIQDAVKERLLRAYMTEGQPIGDRETLARLAGEAGLDAGEVRAMLASDAHTRAVREEEAAALELGIGGVPFFVIDGRYGVSGAQPAELLLEALTVAWNERERTRAAALPASDGMVCGPDGCVVP
jgi:predicted DsbA family dithiol-disulfide isomerase